MTQRTASRGVWPFLCAAIVFAGCVGSAFGQAVEKSKTQLETELAEKLLSGYNLNALPIPEEGLQVEISIALGQFVAINTALETIEFQGWWRMWWKDPRLSWDPEVEGLTAMSFSTKQVWMPDMAVYEQIQDVLSDSLVTVSPDGSCFTSLPRRTKIGCPMMISSFPYDRQRCNFTIGSWSYDGTRVDVAPRKRDVSELLQDGDLPERLPFDLEPYKGFQEFWLAAVKTIWKNNYYNCCPEPYPNLIVEFDLHRSTQTYLSGMVVPLILVTCVGFFSLFMPAPPSGARPALSVTVMLTTATVYFVASRSTPQSNQSTSIGRIYIYSLASSFLLVFLSIITTALNLVQAEDKAQAKNMNDFFDRHDDDGNGTLDRDEFDVALQELDLSPQERIKMMKFFITDQDPCINKEQWTAFSSITDKNDDDAVYHNGLVRGLVHKAMEYEIKKSGKNIGKGFTLRRNSVAAAAQERYAAAAVNGIPAKMEPKPRSTISMSPAPAEHSALPPLTHVAAPSPHLAHTAVPESAAPWQSPDTSYPIPYNIPVMPPGGQIQPSGQIQGMRFGYELSHPQVQWVHGSSFGLNETDGNGHGNGSSEVSRSSELMRTPSLGVKGPSGNPSFKRVAKKMSVKLNQHVRDIATPPRVGRLLSAMIDKWARRLMPLGFFVFLVLEFTGVIGGGEAVGELKRYRDSEGLPKTRVEFYDYRTTEDGRCYKNFPKTRQAENLFDVAEASCQAR